MNKKKNSVCRKKMKLIIKEENRYGAQWKISTGKYLQNVLEVDTFFCPFYIDKSKPKGSKSILLL